ncbi:BTAD domain-containing putative transcriptional regulator [Streptomyces sp. NPDC001544]|uniref:AfsR/SARP family transcriptional regulator n=1 Tax=Streptomyces sp. NPDC001544 TaxID=3364584 RepID=UPI0036C7592B
MARNDPTEGRKASQLGTEFAIGLLGPLTVTRAGVPLDLGPRMRRVLVIRLLLEEGRSVAMDRLCEDLWQGRPPAGAVSSVHAHISRLRAALEPDRRQRGESRVLVSAPAGYALHIPVEARDSVRFEQAVAEGRRLLDQGQVLGARQEIDTALALWRGSPLTDADAHAFALAEIARLNEVRLTAREIRATAMARAGELEQAVIAAEELTAGNPLRETAWSLLIRTLYLSGRTAEALQRYEAVRRLLADDFGLEPGPALRKIQLAILRHDTSVICPKAASGPVPRLSGGGTGTLPPVTGENGTGDHDSSRTQEPSSSVHRNEEEETDAPGVPYRPEAPTPATTAASPPSLTRPAQLPADLPTFVGRRAELDRALALLPEPGRQPASTVVITAINGMGGVGKTTLAVHWAHRIAHRFPDGQLFVNLRGFGPEDSAMSPAEAVRGFLEAIGVAPQRIPAGLDAQAALFRSLIADKRMLIVLDNARDAEQVRPLLPGAPNCLVIVTSRDQLRGLIAASGASPLALGPLKTAEAREALARRLGSDRVAAEPDAVEEIVALCAKLPLALAVVSARAAAHPTFSLASIAAVLRQTHGSLEGFQDTDAFSDARTVFSWSYRVLTPPAARLFRLLALHPGPDLSEPVAAGLAGLPARETRQLLTELTTAHLLTEHEPCRYVLHDLLRAYATELLDAGTSADERQAALHRMCEHYLHSARVATRLIAPHWADIDPGPVGEGVLPEEPADHRQAMDWFSTEHKVLMAVVALAGETGLDSHAWQLAWLLQPYLERRGYWHDQVTVQHTALTAAERQSDLASQARGHECLGAAYIQLGHDDARTHIDRAFELYGELGDTSAQAGICLLLVVMSHRRGENQKARDHAQRSLALYRAAGNRAGTAQSISAIGWCHTVLGDHARAIALCWYALGLHREVGNLRWQAATWNTLGYAHHGLGEHRTATTCYKNAIGLFRNLQDTPNEAGTLARLGDALQATGEVSRARTAWQHALITLETLGRPEADEVRARLRGLENCECGKADLE